MSNLTEMIHHALEAAAQAYAPYSNFSVGACIRSENNHLFAGCNVENAAYNLGNCAETSAISAMISRGERKIKEVVIVGPHSTLISPCGGCRQRLYEFSLPHTLIHLCNKAGDHQTFSIEQLLPNPFELTGTV